MDDKEKKEGRVPKIRFPGFTGEWKQKKLGEMSSSFEYGLNAMAKEFDGKNKYIRITDIDDETRLFIQTNLTSPDIDLNSAENYKLEEGDIVFARTGASVGKTYFYKKSDGLVYYAGFLIRARIKQNYCIDFVFQNTLTKRYERFINITCQRSGQPGINAQEYGVFEIAIPTIREQILLGNFFQCIDSLILIQKNKIEHLQILKKSLLHKMFPKYGEKSPEIRLPGFIDNWERRKLGDISITYSGGTPSVNNKAYYNGNIPFIRSAEINSNFTELCITEEALCNSSAKLVLKGDILYALYGATSGEVGRSRIDGAINQAILVIRPMKNYDADYLVQWLRVNKQYIVDTYLQGGQGNLSGAIVKKLLIDTPSYTEQNKIGIFFNQIDRLITLHQDKLKHLKKLKKGLLEQMLV